MEGSLSSKLKFAIKILGNLGEIKKVEDVIENVINLKDKSVLRVMKPRADIITLKENMLLSDAYEIIKKYNYTKFPVIDEEGNFIGIFYIRDFIRNLDKMYELTVRKLTKPPVYIPYNYNIFQAIEFLREKRISIALVIDEHGTVIGMVTMEDLVEEIVGDIKGEYETSNIIKISEEEYKIAGNISIDEFLEFLKEKFNIQISIEDDINTLSGFIMRKIKKMPKIGDKIKIGHLLLEIIEVEGYRIKFVRLKKL
ncbi:MAG: CBS domain-containing protein [candidate division WOR-3 bacterium]